LLGQEPAGITRIGPGIPRSIASGRFSATVQIGNLEYESDLALLDEGIGIGATQYGKFD